MEYYDFARLEVFRQYHNIQNDLETLEYKYKHIWKCNMCFICKEILKRHTIHKNEKKKDFLLSSKSKLCEDIKDLLSKIMINKLMIFMLDNSKIKLACNEINISKITLTSKDKKKVKYLFAHSEFNNDEHKCKIIDAKINVNKQISSFYKKFTTKFSDFKINLERERVEKQLSKSCDAVESKNNRLKKLIENIINCDKRKISMLDSIKILERNCARELRSHKTHLNYLNTKINNVKKKYIEEVDNVNIKYKSQFEHNGCQTCSICLEEDCRFIKTDCNHYFHVECLSAYIQDLIDSRIKIEIRCPMCREYLK